MQDAATVEPDASAFSLSPELDAEEVQAPARPEAPHRRASR